MPGICNPPTPGASPPPRAVGRTESNFLSVYQSFWIRFKGAVGGGADLERKESIPGEWKGGLKVSGSVKGELGGGVAAADYLRVELYGGTSITWDGFAGSNMAGQLQLDHCLKWDGFYAKVRAELKTAIGQWEWSKDLGKTEGCDIWKGKKTFGS